MKAETKAKIQIGIGLITASLSVVSILIVFLYSFGQHILSTDAPHAPYALFLLSIILPIAYIVAILSKKFIFVWIILVVWSVAWLMSFPCTVLTQISNSASPLGNFQLEAVMFFLTFVVELPTYIWPVVILGFSIRPFGLTVFGTCGVVFMACLWLGAGGIRQWKSQKVSEENG